MKLFARHVAVVAGLSCSALASSCAISAPDMVQYRRDGTQYSVLHSAVSVSRPVQVICKLLKLGADPLAKDRSGQTPAELARAEGHTLIAQLLDRAAEDTQAQSTA